MSLTDTKTKSGQEVGLVRTAKDYLLTIEGLPSAKIDDLISDEDGNLALVTSLVKGGVKALALHPMESRAGQRFYIEDKENFFAFGEHLFGSVVDALGRPVRKDLSEKKGISTFKLDIVAPGVNHRENVTEQFVTGITAIDTIFPLGKGQRQMFFGPVKSGKTQLLSNIIRNQRGTETVCIYAAIGKPADFLDQLLPLLFGDDEYDTIVMSALSNEPPPMISIAPATALLMAEHFQQQGKDVVLVLDDMGSHAKYLREIDLLKERLPGRESYPGDLFYQQAHLMERGGNFSGDIGGGSITLLPVLKTDIESYSDLLSTNLIAATDGHLSCSSSLYRQGSYPSIVVEESVTRIGRNTQNYVQKQLSVRVVSLLAEYKKQQEYTRFGTGVSSQAEEILHQGKLLKYMLNQEMGEYLSPTTQVLFLSLLFTNFLKQKDEEFLRQKRGKILNTLKEDETFDDLKNVVDNKDISLEDFINKLEQKTSVLEKKVQ